MRHCRLGVVTAVASLLLAGGTAAAAPAAAAATTTRVSVGSAEQQGNGFSVGAAVSSGGRYVAFASEASNLVAGDSNGVADVFVRDRLAGTTRRVSVGPSGQQANDASGFRPTISANGRYVAFASFASNLVPGDVNGVGDVFVRDLVAGTTRLVSVGLGGPGDNGSFEPAISADGRHVAFSSAARNLVPGDTNEVADLFVHDLLAGMTSRVSVGPSGREANGRSTEPAISADGAVVAFASEASNLVAGDSNGMFDVFVRDRLAGTTRRVSVGPGGRQANGNSSAPALSADGRFVAFNSEASNLVTGDTGFVDVFVRDRATGTTRRISVARGGGQANGLSASPSLSADGRFVAFTSEASNLVAGDSNGQTDVFVRDRVAGVTRRVSVGPGGRQANGASSGASISANGRHVGFESSATNLVPGDTNGQTDVFVHDQFGDVATR